MTKRSAAADAYLAKLPSDRRAALSAVRQVILEHLPEGYEEGVQYGMIGYYVPHTLYPAGYHCKPSEPLPFAALGSQKNHMSLHLMFAYGNDALQKWLATEWKRSGKKLDMGKACLRFRAVDDLALDVIGKLFAKVPVATYIDGVTKALAGRQKAPKKSAGAKKGASASSGKRKNG